MERISQPEEAQHLIFKVGDMQCAIPFPVSEEILKPGDRRITQLPGQQKHIAGIFNHLGRVTPIIDINGMFDQGNSVIDQQTHIIVIEAQTPDMPGCWIEKACGKPDCPAYENPNHLCWRVEKTLCGGEVQGSVRAKVERCMECSFQRQMRQMQKSFFMGIATQFLPNARLIPHTLATQAGRLAHAIAVEDGIILVLDMNELVKPFLPEVPSTDKLRAL